jgi:hypothetical protein
VVKTLQKLFVIIKLKLYFYFNDFKKHVDMRKFSLFLTIIALPILVILTAYKSGSPGGYSSSPGDSGSSCTSCHSGTSQSVSGWISTNIPVTGYTAGEIYNITITATNASAARFGFELTAEDANNKKNATFTITNTSETKLTNANRAVTHTTAGTTPSGNTKSWNFEWTAPQESTGVITFYASVNAANGNGNTSGDLIYKTSTVIAPNSTFVSEHYNSFKFYPNPSAGLVNFEAKINSASTDLLIFNTKGQLVEHKNISNGIFQINLSYLPNGVYYLKLSDGVKKEFQKLVLY